MSLRLRFISVFFRHERSRQAQVYTFLQSLRSAPRFLLKLFTLQLFAVALADVAAVEAFAPPLAVAGALLRAGVLCMGGGRGREGRRE